MNNDFIPQQDSALLLWCTNYKKQISANAKTLGVSDAEAQSQANLCDGMIAAITDADAKKKLQAASVAAKEAAYTSCIGELRTRIVRLKSSVEMTDEMQKAFGIAPVSVNLDYSAYKATLTADMFADFVRLKFVKAGTDGINIYNRKKGETVWQFLARDTKSPYDDHITLTIPGQPEHWEYRALGVVNDAEIGQPSDIVEIVYGG